MKESRIQETGYTRGLKSGSFNYLNKGTKIDFNEALSLNYGNATNISNSTLSHNLNLSFEGDKGISEIYGSGLFPNNRGLSAWKKIRYETSDNLKTNGKKIRELDASNIWVDATVDMNTHETSEYVFSYAAGAKDAVIETYDAAGWSNRTGSRRIDVEHTTLLTGNFEVTNIFQEIMPAGSDVIGDWLPCCFNSTLPPIRQSGDVWPAQVVIDTLKEYNTQPKIKARSCNTTTCGKWILNNSTKELEQTCKLNISAKGQTCKEELKDCPTGGCPGFQCITTFNEAQYESSPETESEKRLNDIQLTYSYSTNKALFPSVTAESWVDVDRDGKPDAADQVVYEIIVKNTGRTALNNLTLKGILPNNAVSNLSYEVAVDESGSHIVSLIQPEWDSTQRTFTYHLDSMNIRTRKTIHLRTFMREEAKRDDAKFSVIGYSIGGTVVQDDASWLPAYEMDMDIALTNAIEALSKKMPHGGDTYKPNVVRDMLNLNESHLIYKVSVDNPNNTSLNDVSLTITIPEKADPKLSYEVISIDGSIKDVTNWRKSPESVITYEWPEIETNESKEVQILVSKSNSSELDIDSFGLETKVTRTNGSRYVTDEADQIQDSEAIEKAFVMIQEKIKP